MFDLNEPATFTQLWEQTERFNSDHPPWEIYKSPIKEILRASVDIIEPEDFLPRCKYFLMDHPTGMIMGKPLVAKSVKLADIPHRLVTPTKISNMMEEAHRNLQFILNTARHNDQYLVFYNPIQLRGNDLSCRCTTFNLIIQ